MGRNFRILIVISLVVIAAGITAYALQARRAPHADGFAVLELYTSEGCSSCPPADLLLLRIAKEAREQHTHVYPLSFHVDTWNQPAFSDPFSAAEHTRRQENYYKHHIYDGVYTPEMIVNGTKVVPARDEPPVRSAVAEALQTTAPINLKLALQRTGDEIIANVDLSAQPAGTVLNVALVERGLSNHVRKGENTGLTLEHENVVRVFKTIDVSGPHASIPLTIPKGVKTNNCSVIAYAQNAKLTVLGATEEQVPSPATTATSQP
jgi:hypothetical protein